jgi:uncharacterized protein with PIN domain
MGSLKRSMRRKQRLKAAKTNSAELKKKLGAFREMPETCTTCDRKLDKVDHEALDNWHIEFNAQLNQATLYCDACWKMSSHA